MGPRPTTELEPARQRWDCEQYGKCLEAAARLEWRGFSCRLCDRYRKRQTDYDTIMEESIPFINLLRTVIFNPKRHCHRLGGPRCAGAG